MTLKVQKTVTAIVEGDVMFQAAPTSSIGDLFEIKIRHSDGSWRTSVFNKEELGAIADAIAEVLD